MRIDLRVQLCPVRDQGVRSTCAAIATSTAHECLRRSLQPLSPEYLHWHASSGQANIEATLPAVAAALRSEGQPLESACPYVYGIRAPAWSPPAGAQVFRRDSTLRAPTELQRIEDSIAEGNCPILGITLPPSFYSPQEPWIIPPRGAPLCFHAVLGVGVGECHGKLHVLVRNSWGEEWGDNGHAWLSEEFLRTHLQLLLILREEVT